MSPGSSKRILIVCFSLGFAGTSIWAQTNSWTNSTSGSWEEPHWSLGVLPATNQNILFTNAWQALAIGPATSLYHPETMNVTSLTVSAPSNSFNELLLNYSGLDTPLVVGDNLSNPSFHRFIVDSNSAVVMLSSTLQIGNATMGLTEYGVFSIGGTFDQGEYSQVTARFMHLGDIGPGIYNLTNGLVAIGLEYVGGGYPARFNQFGGTNSTSLRLLYGGEYDLYGGSLVGDVTFQGGTLKQIGSFVSCGLHLVNGTYSLMGGVLSTPGLAIPEYPPPGGGDAHAGFLQTGGTNLSNGLYLRGSHGPPIASSGSYTLTNGALLISGGLAISGLGGFIQSGGVHTNAGIGLAGSTSLHGLESANYYLSDGALYTASIAMTGGTFAQSGGSNLVAGGIDVTGGGGYVGGGVSYPNSIYSLAGGFLSDDTVTVSAAIGGGFLQSGGIHVIANLLHILTPVDNFYGYILGAGQLTALNITLDNAPFHHQGGSLSVTGTLALNGGLWDESTSSQIFGRLQLGLVEQATNSTIQLPAAASTLHFAGSSSQNWSNRAILTIENWNGSIAGGGLHQVVFGNSATALTSQQLSQIQFHNPAGTSGMFPATILASGEIVPSQWLSSRRNGNGLILQWASTFTLQSATNVAGPYQDLNVTSPYSASFTVTKQFFRLRR